MSSTSIHLRSGSPVFQTPRPILILAGLASLGVGLGLAVRPELGVAALLGVLFLPILLLNLPLGLAAWISFVFVENVIAIPTLLIIMVVLAWIGSLRVQGDQVAAVLARHRVMFSALLALFVWVCASLTWAQDTEPVTGVIFFWVLVSLGFTVLATTIAHPRHLAMVCAAFVFGAVASVIVGLFVDASSADPGFAADDPGRFGGTLGDANFLAAGLVPAIALSIGLGAVARSPGARWLLAVGLIVLAAGLGATGSRGGLVAAAVSVTIALLLIRSNRLKAGAIIVVGAVLASLWVATTSPGTWDRVRDFGGGGSGRTDLWTVALRISEDRPLLGVGADNFQTASPQYVTRPGIAEARLVLDSPHVAHNLYLQQLAETGVIGLALLLTVIGGALRATWEGAQRLTRAADYSYSALARGVLVAQLSVLTASLFLSNALDKRLWILLALGPIVLTVAIRAERNADA